ncbi:uncharacterized protein KY384_000267 [Bacidia gigantensis]|uniref:uncharacterized protein n=1 Tax=Bacidia gigantensis TaxID=2732470 RepID=UPI001D05B459|nr:uncharacterized protein KY384_000267 [Bacidia gigantensis]KAG8526274.1 hypothetical protein KY384_000267 [Bacidia gigantensis]
MRFGATLKSSTYQPWASSYIDYAKLKKLLREEQPENDEKPWTDDDEARFTEELLNIELEKVNAFQGDTYRSLRERTTKCENRLHEISDDGGKEASSADREKVNTVATDVLLELDNITKEINELEKYSRVNFTGFLKAAKKHDRRRGAKYKVRPLLQVRLAALPFNSEDYSPLLHELSMMYSFARQLTDGGSSERSKSRSESKFGGEKYTSYKFWVHPENLLEIKTYVLRRLPVLVYNPKTSKNAESGGSDPTITSLYFDSPQFALYNNKIGKATRASSLRLRWYGQLSDKPEMTLEKKTIEENGNSEVLRVPIKEKYIQPFITNQYKMEKTIGKLRDREGTAGNGVASLEHNVEEMQTLIKEHNLEPMVRATYARTAFQIPGDDKVRISIDTDLAFIREDSLDEDRPCRDPQDWHRGDIDRFGLKFPYSEIRHGEVAKFPYAVLEIKVREGASKKTTDWVRDLMASHLVTEEPRFSKFVHGVAQLFEDHVNSFPFWLSDLETDIRKDPQEAFHQEQEKRAKEAADEQAVGSFLGSKSVASFKAAVGSPVTKPPFETRRRSVADLKGVPSNADIDHDGDEAAKPSSGVLSGVLSFSPFSNSRYARAKRAGAKSLPSGVSEPRRWIKDMNPVAVEPKVWLANERTFVKWQHVSILLASLSLGLYNAAGESNDVARSLAVIYTLIAIFAAVWGWWMYLIRSRMIAARSGKDFDNVIGPIVVCICLAVALVLNFSFKVWLLPLTRLSIDKYLLVP